MKHAHFLVFIWLLEMAARGTLTNTDDLLSALCAMKARRVELTRMGQMRHLRS